MDEPTLPSAASDRPGPGGSPGRFYRAVASDFDGTLTAGGPPAGRVLEALVTARSSGLRLVLATGRIYSELRSVWPQVFDYMDAVVAENGAVLVTPSGTTLLGAPVDTRLSDLLADRGAALRRGEVLLAGKTSDESVVTGAIRDLELDCQTVANRGELMVLPAGVSKGTGVRAALEELGLSHHNAVGIGDAENDLALLEGCELGVAVADAVGSLRMAADLVIDAPAGEAVIRLLEGDLLGGRTVLHSRRHRLSLGLTDSGEPVELPTSQFNLLVAGGTGSGKSFLTGLVAEQLIRQGYSVLISDPEGDHADLARLHPVMVEGGALHVPQPDEVMRLLHNGYASVVLDLSGLGPPEATDYLAHLLPRVEAHRRATGLPHWIFLDEAHGAAGRPGRPLAAFDASQKG
ncbi:MAG: HAD family hydrolase, partial [Acidimicrobiales bacterium]